LVATDFIVFSAIIALGAFQLYFHYVNVPGGPFPNQGAASFAIPGANSGGAKDWVLVLRTIPKTIPRAAK